MSKLKAAIIGAAGRIAFQVEKDKLRTKPASHYGAYVGNPKIELVACCDSDMNKLAKIGEYHNICLYSDYEDMFRHENNIDVVSVCTPADSHRNIVIGIAKNRSPQAIFCEKPLAESAKEAYAMVSCCKDHDVSLAVNYSRRWSKTYQRIKNLIQNDKVLEIIGVTNGERNGEINTHMLDLFNWYKQNTTKLKYIQLPTKNYLIFEIHIFTDNRKISVLDNNSAILTGNISHSTRYSDDKGEPIKEINSFITPSSWYDHKETLMQLAVENIKNHILKDEELLCTGRDGVKTLELAEDLNLGQIR